MVELTALGEALDHARFEDLIDDLMNVIQKTELGIMMNSSSINKLYKIHDLLCDAKREVIK